jgi:hypothetical protein
VPRDFFARRSLGHQRIRILEEFVAPRELVILFKRLRAGAMARVCCFTAL